MVPNHGCRRKSDLIALFQKPPADIHIVAGLPKLPVKTAEGNEHASPERHIAPRHMLGRLIIEHDMAGISGTCCDAFCNPIVIRRTKIWPPNGINSLLQHALR